MDLWLLLSLVVFLGGCSPGQSLSCTGNGCQCTGDVSIDLSGFFSYPVTGILDPDPNNAKFTYSFSPCTPMTCYTGQPNTAALCQYNSQRPNQSVSLGSTQDIAWSVDSEHDFTLTISGGAPDYKSYARLSTVNFKYGNVSANNITYTGEKTDEGKKTLTYNFQVEFGTTNAGGGGGSIAGPVGIVLIVLLIVGVATYFIVGGLIMYFHKGARGMEVIPNYTFWKDFPILIKDGCLFTISPCRHYYADKKGYQAL